MQDTRIQSLIWEDPTCHRATKFVCHSYWVWVREPGSGNYWAHGLQVLKPTPPRAYALQQEKLPQWQDCVLQLEKSLHSKEDPAWPDINHFKKKEAVRVSCNHGQWVQIPPCDHQASFFSPALYISDLIYFSPNIFGLGQLRLPYKII